MSSEPGAGQSVLAATSDLNFALHEYHERFYLPSENQLAALANQYITSDAFTKLPQYLGTYDAFQRAMTLIRSPWVDAQDAMRSVSSLADLSFFHNSLLLNKPFDESVSSSWRNHLGDWRDPITFPALTITDFVARSNFYVDLGLDPKLTDFPAQAFAETVEVTKLRAERPALVRIYGSPIPASDSQDEENDFARTNMAHDWLQRFETMLRRFIDEVMTKEFGSDWPKLNVPKDVYEDWQEKSAKAEKAGAKSRPLIAYADFTHYEIIICRRQNWKVFARTFRREESVRESLQRLYLPRISTMHARPITPEDELLLYAEIKRLMRAFNKA